ncbi:D-glycero-beta-D-manno-heptose 1-phosphate adenylyltransferase [Nocardioides sp. cx-169]|uniref:D-glycero-beta-D-manno-heptose 1-phosphate adenylyltransferase n=1 Tax=Nocardioides sp. cx-169 TaxID=2899080 RepID=UPI001E46FC7D|nr:D-glycero-beta-D-manno-heptose 1-phosphate adenylyltransferase [Nocardioides sp. cx-169]MCD4532563.1 D-glycero-beta-D-manno-heptose 1-phosphate adenylyltransferase [Nocardioides sp. cx-169]
MPGPLVVLGDSLLDADLSGTASRLAPDAPVPVLDRLEEVRRPGGAALAAAMAARSGHDVVLVTALADDADAATLAGLVADAGVRLVPVGHDGATVVKRRVRSSGQSLLRLDSGVAGTPGDLGPDALEALAGAGAVLVSDYGHGLTDRETVRRAVAAAARRAPVVWDPHPRGSAPVAGCRLVTPNRDEASLLAGRSGLLTGGRTGLAAIAEEAAALVRAWAAHAVAVTLGPDGALLSHGETSPSVVPAPAVRAGDTCGAGDRFASAAAVALASGAVTLEAVQDAVLAAADFVAGGGAAGLAVSGSSSPAPDPLAAVRSSGGTVVATGGCFDLLHAGHVATLEAARALGDCLVVCLNSDHSVRRLKGPGRPLVPQQDRARVLAALAPVDAVLVFEEDTPAQVLRGLRPDVWVKGGDYAGAELPEAALLREWGGVSVVVPYLDGRSTTRLVSTAAARAVERS